MENFGAINVLSKQKTREAQITVFPQSRSNGLLLSWPAIIYFQLRILMKQGCQRGCQSIVMCQSSFQTIMLDLKRLIHLAKIQSVYVIGEKNLPTQNKNALGWKKTIKNNVNWVYARDAVTALSPVTCPLTEHRSEISGTWLPVVCFMQGMRAHPWHAFLSTPKLHCNSHWP